MNKRNALMLCTVIAATAILIITAVTLIFARAKEKNELLSGGAQSEENEIDVSAAPKKAVTLLIAGKDASSSLTDALMLVRADPNDNSVTVLQIPRDTYAEYTDSSYKKINGACSSLGSAEKLCDFLSSSFGINVDGYAISDMSVLAFAVDALGGVEIELDDPIRYDDGEGFSLILDKGRQTLDGETALRFVRYRSGYVRGDIGRMDAQKLFLASLFKKISETDSFTLASVIGRLLPRLDTNISVDDAIRLAELGMSLSADSIRFITLAGDEVTATQSGASYYSVSAPAAEEIFVKYFGAEVGSFDKEGLFRNERYREFCNIYDNFAEYSVHTASSVCENGIRIDKTY